MGDASAQDAKPPHGSPGGVAPLLPGVPPARHPEIVAGVACERDAVARPLPTDMAASGRRVRRIVPAIALELRASELGTQRVEAHDVAGPSGHGRRNGRAALPDCAIVTTQRATGRCDAHVAAKQGVRSKLTSSLEAHVRRFAASLLALSCAVFLASAGVLYVLHGASASDHQDSPLTVARPGADITDVYVFPANDPSKVVLAMNVWPLIPPGLGDDDVLRPGRALPAQRSASAPMRPRTSSCSSSGRARTEPGDHALRADTARDSGDAHHDRDVGAHG